MANSAGKNVILLVVAVAAIGGAIYLLTTMKTENPQDQNVVHFIDPESVLNDPQDVVTMTAGELKTRRDDVLLSTPEADARRVYAGQCPSCSKFFPLVGHGETPPNCPVCNTDLSDY